LKFGLAIGYSLGAAIVAGILAQILSAPASHDSNRGLTRINVQAPA
jgi:hypothetical protein